MHRWKPSRFNLTAWDSGDSYLIFNSLTGAFLELRDSAAREAADLLGAKGALDVAQGDELGDALVANGILVPEQANELARAEAVHLQLGRSNDRLRLILMPTEKCNFRCRYCYEDFARGRMPGEIRTAVVRLVERRAAELRSLSISWFGGEPLIALDVVEDVSAQLIDLCARHDIAYSASMTTNAFLLGPANATRCFNAGVRQFQVTIDGPPQTHDKLRVLAGGGETFATILENLRSLRSRPEAFAVRLRVNYTPEVVALLPGFVRFLGEEFGGDPRFSVNCHAVGRWGGPNDAALDTCDRESAQDVEVRFMRLATEAGFGVEYWQASMQVHGSVCYAADPHAFVIGSDGAVYKCTVAFNDPRNRIGVVEADGTLAISDELHRLWTSGGEEVDTGCQHCAFRPACQGNSCPLERLQTGEKSCPPVRLRPDHYLPVLAANARGAAAKTTC